MIVMSTAFLTSLRVYQNVPLKFDRPIFMIKTLFSCAAPMPISTIYLLDRIIGGVPIDISARRVRTSGTGSGTVESSCCAT